MARMNLLVLSCRSGTRLLQYCEADTEASDWFLKQDYYVEAAQILYQQAQHARYWWSCSQLHVYSMLLI